MRTIVKGAVGVNKLGGVIKAERILTPMEDLADGVVHISGGKVTHLEGGAKPPQARVPIWSGHYLIPGMIDLLINYAAGADGAEGTATATRQPAGLLGLGSKARIDSGCDADLMLLDESWRVDKTWVGGDLVYDAATR